MLPFTPLSVKANSKKLIDEILFPSFYLMVCNHTMRYSDGWIGHSIPVNN